MQDAMYFEALLCVCLATWLPSIGAECERDRAFHYHHSNVISRLRERLQSADQCTDNATILTVASLGTIDYITGNHAAATSHVQGMRQILTMRGGVGNIDPMDKLVKINVAAYESLWSFVTESKTPSDEHPPSHSILQKGQLPTYLAHPFKPEICTLLSKLPNRFCELGLEGIFSQQLIMILSSLNDIVHLVSGSDRSPSSTPSSSPSASSSVSIIEPSSLVGLLGDVQQLSSLHTTITEHILCHGLIAYIYLLRHLYFHDNLGPFYTSALEVLTDKCIRHSPDVDDLDRGCYFWVSTVIGTVLMNISCPSDDRFRVFDHLISRYIECQDYHLFVSMISGFFWSSDLDSMVRKNWEQAMARRMTPRVSVSSPSDDAQIKKEIEEPPRPSRMRIRDVIL
jgi:hypothetical protein